LESEAAAPSLARNFELLDRAASSAVITVRDDQYDFAWLLDAVHVCRRHGGEFRLVDSGKNEPVLLGWLAEGGARVYTSDEARPDPREVIPVRLSARRSGAPTFYYIYDDLGPASRRPGALPDILELGRSGVDLHLSNRRHAREAGLLVDLALACAGGGARLVYYHFGRFEAWLEGLVRSGGWVHWAAADFNPEEDMTPLLDAARSARRAGSGLILHLSAERSVAQLGELFAAGVFLQFHGPRGVRSSDWGRLEGRTARRRPDERASYLRPDFLP
jgi:hypothetical protein